MITKTGYTVPKSLIDTAREQVSLDSFRQTLNTPTGNFFYDPWNIKEEYKGSVWENILNTLPYTVGEARIIVLNQTDSYSSHSDIDDRWHLNINSKCGYLIDLDNEQMFKLETDYTWYYMDASLRHTAVNFGNRPRVQLVARKLLTRSNRQDLVSIEITSKIPDLEDARYEFDNSISAFLNAANKENAINNFTYTDAIVTMDIAPEYIDRLIALATNNFGVKIND